METATAKLTNVNAFQAGVCGICGVMGIFLREISGRVEVSGSLGAEAREDCGRISPDLAVAGPIEPLLEVPRRAIEGIEGDVEGGTGDLPSLKPGERRLGLLQGPRRVSDPPAAVGTGPPNGFGRPRRLEAAVEIPEAALTLLDEAAEPRDVRLERAERRSPIRTLVLQGGDADRTLGREVLHSVGKGLSCGHLQGGGPVVEGLDGPGLSGLMSHRDGELAPCDGQRAGGVPDLLSEDENSVGVANGFGLVGRRPAQQVAEGLQHVTPLSQERRVRPTD